MSTFSRRLRAAAGLVALAGGLWSARPADASILVGASGPAATFTGSTSSPVNFTTEGSAAWAYFAGTGGNAPASPAYQKASAPTAFSALVGLTPTGTSTVGSSRTGNTAAGVAAAVTTTDAATAAGNLTNLPGYTYVSSSNSGVGFGMRTTYSVPAGTTQALSVYCYTLSGVIGRLQVTETDGAATASLYDDGAAGVALPASNSQPTKGGGVYRLTVTNDDDAPRLLTFAYTIAAYPAGVTSGQIGFEGITAATVPVPEPTTAAVAGIAGLGLLAGRRRRGVSRG